MGNRRGKTKYGASSGQRNRIRTEATQPRSRRLIERAGSSKAQPQEQPKGKQFAPAIHRIPNATYRFQFNRDVTFQHAQELLDYLRELGISDLYASPLFQAGPSSTHGYDICGYDALNPALGTEHAFRKLACGLRSEGMGLLADMVPNHMGSDCSNKWWWDVLEKGSGSNYAWWFDIDWKPANPLTHGKVLLPVLEDHYFKVLEAGKLHLVYEGGRFAIAYHDRRFPLSPIASRTLKQQAAKRGADAILKDFTGQVGDPITFQPLHALLRQQHYRLAFWRSGSQEINYRRFFDVTELVSMRVELPEVFEGTHELLFRFLEEGLVTGLRIDHPDGLWDPKKYFERLQEKFAGIIDPDKTREWEPGGDGRRPLYVVAEKILSGEESLPDDWPVDGTTGYDFLNKVNGLFVDGANASAFDRICREFTGRQDTYAEVAYRSKKEILEKTFISELSSATERLKQIAAHTRYGQDFTIQQLRLALLEVIAAFPVYRSYVGNSSAPSVADQENIDEAIEAALKRNPAPGAEVFRFVRNILLLENPSDASAETEGKIREFVLKFQQLTGPVTAKGLEDTAFYNFNRLISLNEVGGEPSRFAVTPEQFHEFNLRMLATWPHTLLATATHDTKRGEDARARINVLSEMPEEWQKAASRWRELNRGAKAKIAIRQDPQLPESEVPSRNDEYLFYQTLIGVWTDEAKTTAGLKALRERVSAFMLKAIREAKAHTSWTQPNSAYEQGVIGFVESALADSGNKFLADFNKFHERIAYFGHLNSLAQTLLKLTSPGVPDIYQGTELWDFSLVDPDNRRSVDYSLRRKTLRELKARFSDSGAAPANELEELSRAWSGGCIKQFLIWRALNFRRENESLFRTGGYVPLRAAGAKAQHVVAFARTEQQRALMVIVPRLCASMLGEKIEAPLGVHAWADTRLNVAEVPEGGEWRNVFTGERLKAGPQIEVASLLNSFPVGMWCR